MLSFSGGGTRAAAFSYGVLEELRRTEIVVDGQRRRLIDEVDVITGVSGGSFTALSYALYGERLFSEYEERFLKRDVQGALLARTLNPFNWPKFVGGSAGRSELAAEYYDEILFEGATFGDLLDKPGAGRDRHRDRSVDRLAARVLPERLRPALLGSEQGSPVARGGHLLGGAGRAVAGDVQQLRRHLRVSVSGLGEGRRRPRHPRAAGGTRAFSATARCRTSRTARIARTSTWSTAACRTTSGCAACWRPSRSSRRARRSAERSASAAIRRIVLLVVNARSSPRTDWDRSESPPGFAGQLLQSAGVPIDRYSFETVETMKDRAEIMEWRRELLVARGAPRGRDRGGGRSERAESHVEVLDVSFDAIPDPKERAYFMNLPTSFVLPPRTSTGCARSPAGCCASRWTTRRSYANSAAAREVELIAGCDRLLFTGHGDTRLPPPRGRTTRCRSDPLTVIAAAR